MLHLLLVYLHHDPSHHKARRLFFLSFLRIILFIGRRWNKDEKHLSATDTTRVSTRPTNSKEMRSCHFLHHMSFVCMTKTERHVHLLLSLVLFSSLVLLLSAERNPSMLQHSPTNMLLLSEEGPPSPGPVLCTLVQKTNVLPEYLATSVTLEYIPLIH